MTNGKFVLIVSGKEDPMWPFILEACLPDERHKLLLFATDNPQTARCTFNPVNGEVEFVLEDKHIRDEEIKSIWWRRIVYPDARNFSEELRMYCQNEYLVFLENLEFMLPGVFWMSKPSMINRAQNKAWQLIVAKRLGFTVLDTIFTNDPNKVSKQVQSGEVIYKAIRSPRVPVKPDWHSTVFTTILTEDHLKANVEGVLACPGIVQSFCRKIADIRVTVFYDKVFAVKIESQQGTTSKIDFRAGARHLPHLPHRLPSDIENLCIALVKELDLSFGAIDLALREDGAYIFFEINPNGQWGWLEEKTGLPLRRGFLDVML